MSQKVAVVGATGAVGQVLLKILEERNFTVDELVPFASERSVGKEVSFRGKTYKCQAMTKGCFMGIRYAFFDASDAVSKEWVPEAAESGAWVIDNSATFRMDEDVLLLVPEVNGDELVKRIQGKSAPSVRERILAGPNCSTVGLVMALKPIQARWGLKRVVVSTFQSTSGAGAAAMDELRSQTRDALDGKPAAPKAFPHPIAFNCIPQIGGFKDGGITSEEEKIIAESRKLLGMPKLRVSATAIRVPTFSGHGESVNVETERAFDLGEVRAAIASHPGVKVLDSPEKKIYPLNVDSNGIEGASGHDPVYVGRLRMDNSVENGLNLWVVSDNLRKGAALNAVQIAELVQKTLAQ